MGAASRFTLSAAHFALWAQAGAWIVEPGTIELMAGSASDAIHARATLTIVDENVADQSPASLPVPSGDS